MVTPLTAYAITYDMVTTDNTDNRCTNACTTHADSNDDKGITRIGGGGTTHTHTLDAHHLAPERLVLIWQRKYHQRKPRG